MLVDAVFTLVSDPASEAGVKSPKATWYLLLVAVECSLCLLFFVRTFAPICIRLSPPGTV